MTDPTLDDVLKQAAAMRSAGQLDGAAKLLADSVAKDPGAHAASFALAMLFFQQRNWRDAERFARSAVAAGGDVYAGGLGHILAETGQYAEAEAWLRRALATNACDALALARLGEICLRQMRLDEAFAYLDSALMLRPNLAEAQLNRDAVLAHRAFFEKVGATVSQFAGCDAAAIASAEIEIAAAFSDANGKPRFMLAIPRSLILTDLGAALLFQHEVTAGGWEALLRKFLDAQLHSDDVFIDVGAHWGIHSLTAATTRFSNQVSVLAIEAHPENVDRLRNWVARNGLQDGVEIISTAVGDRDGLVELRINASSMGHGLDGTSANFGSPVIKVDLTTLDGIMAARASLQWRRVILKIDVEGHEFEVLSGARKLLGSGHVAAVIWENGLHIEPRILYERRKATLDLLNSFGFAHYHFEGGNEHLTPLPTLDNRCDVYSLSLELRGELAASSP